MPLQPYLRLLRIPRLPTPMLIMLLTRVPMTATGLTLTLHIVSELGRGYAAAGLVGTATTLGTALGAPTMGRLIDRHGLRPVTALCGACSCAFWVSAPHLTFEALLVVSLPAGALIVPAGSLARQVITALVPTEQRRTAFSLDMMSVELSFMVGPMLAIMLATRYSTSVTLTGIGAMFGLLAVVLWLVNPPIRSAEELGGASVRPPVRSWVTGTFVATLLVALGAMFVLVGTELSALAALRASGDVAWTGVVMATMAGASLVGAVVHGSARRSLSQLALMTTLAVLVLPVSLIVQPWWLLALALVPMNLVCAPTLAATSEAITGRVPYTVRGLAMGLQDSATRIGAALGSPVVGSVLDHAGAGWGFAAAGAGGLVFAAAGAFLRDRGRRDRAGRPTPSAVTGMPDATGPRSPDSAATNPRSH